MSVLADPVAEARRLCEAADGAGLAIRAVGGVAVALAGPGIGRLRPARTYHDIDLVAPAGTPRISAFLTALGYEAAQPFNTLNGSERLLFHDPSGRRLDVFIDTLRMCHALPFRDRLTIRPLTLPPADLLLSKLQIVELTERDIQDITALLADHGLAEHDDHGIGLGRIRDICGADWGWWRTVDGNLEHILARWDADADAADPIVATARSRARTIRSVLADCPKSVRWRTRALVGPRLRWYDLPEEVR